MKVLKFGGTSVGSSKNINKVISILENYSKSDAVICVVSAVGGITDKLLLAGKQAQNKDISYKDTLNLIKDIHFSIINELNLGIGELITQHIDSKFNELEDLLNGIYLINELSPKTSDKLVSFHES